MQVAYPCTIPCKIAGIGEFIILCNIKKTKVVSIAVQCKFQRINLKVLFCLIHLRLCFIVSFIKIDSGKPAKTNQYNYCSQSDQQGFIIPFQICLLYTSDAADEEDSVDLGGRRII